MKTVRLLKETNEVQRVTTLKSNRNKRHRYKEFVIEGYLSIDEAIKMGWKVKALFYDFEKKLSSWAQETIQKSKAEVCYEIPSALMQKISDKEETTELIAIVESKTLSFDRYLPKKKEVVVVLDEPKSPGNVGMIIRSMVAFGADALVISGHGADEYDPKCILASVGTFFSLPIYRVDGVNAFKEKIDLLKKQRSIRVVASGDKGSERIQETNFDADVLFLILGNETNGVSFGYKTLSDTFVQIPLPGRFTSLNIGAAASIFLYEILKKEL